MNRKNLKRDAREAISLTGILASRLPAGCAIPAEELFDAVWPLVVRLTRLKRRARRDKKAAKAYRRLCAEVAGLIRTQPDRPVPLPALLNTVPMDASCWRTVLAPGVSAEALEAA